MSKLPADDPSLPQNAKIETFTPSPMDASFQAQQDDQEEPDLIDAVIEYRKNHPRTAGEAFRADINKEIVRHIKELGRLTRIAAEELGETNKITITGHRERDPYPDNFTHQYIHTPNGLAEMHPGNQVKTISDQENRLLYEKERTEVTNHIHHMVKSLQQICDLAADKLGLNTEIIIQAHPDQPKIKAQMTVYSLLSSLTTELQARQDSLQNFEKP